MLIVNSKLYGYLIYLSKQSLNVFLYFQSFIHQLVKTFFKFGFCFASLFCIIFNIFCWPSRLFIISNNVYFYNSNTMSYIKFQISIMLKISLFICLIHNQLFNKFIFFPVYFSSNEVKKLLF